MSLESDLRTALESRLATLPGLPAVAWENVEYTEREGVPYLEPRLLPAEDVFSPTSATGATVAAGIYQVIISVPTGRGRAEYAELLDALRAHFPRALTLDHGDARVVVHKVWAGAGYRRGAFMRVPVSVRYRAITKD